MQKQAKLVVVGAGIVGASVTYHLAKMGWRDIVVVDQGPLFETGGSTSHAPGLLFLTNPSKMMTEFAMYSVDLYSQLSLDGQSSFYPVGGIEVAGSRARWEDLKRRHGLAKSYGLESHLISPAEVRDMIPLIDPQGIHGGYYVPKDGDVKAIMAVEAMAREAEAMGAAKFYGHTFVSDIELEKGRVKAVVTDQGRIETETVLLCTNIWAPVLAKKVGVTIPLMAVQHLYAITSPVPELAGETREIVQPILRHQDRSMYFRQHADAYGIGSYQHEPMLVAPPTLGKTAMQPFTADHFAATWQATTELLPPLAQTDLTTRFNGMFAFTSDAMPILGPVSGLDGFWLAVGVWVTHGGGVGRAVAEWLVNGAPNTDLREADVNRFHTHVSAQKYIELRCAQQYREVYDIIHPMQQLENPRDLRLSPFQARFVAQQAICFESAGWERPQWFGANAALLEQYDVPNRTDWAARHWSPIQGVEHLATRERAGLFDLTAFTKLTIKGPGALAYLNYLAANQVDRPIGQVVYTALLNHNGGIKADLTITRLAEDEFLVLTGGGMGMLDQAWLRHHAPTDGSVTVIDHSAGYCGLGLWGPKARDLLQSVCQNDLSNQAFPYFTAQQLIIETVPVLALRLSYVGELGWELYTGPEYGLRLWDILWAAGQSYGLIAAGGGAFDSLRLEKGYRLWGNDIHTEYNPYQAGLGWAVKLDKGDFLGREALLSVQQTRISRRLCCLTLDDPQAVVLGKEPILDGERVLGYVTSANMGYTIGRYIVYGYLPMDYAEPGRQVEVEYFGRRYRATVAQEPLFDPQGERLKG